MITELVVIAGLSTREESAFTNYIKRRIKKTTKIKFFSVSKRNPCYQLRNIDSLLISVANSVASSSPEKIRLLYLPYHGSEDLTNSFFPFADSKSIFPEDDFDIFYSNYYDCTQCFDNFVTYIRDGMLLKKRPNKKHFSLLPLKNFKIKNVFFEPLLKEWYFLGENQDDPITSKLKMNSEWNCYEDSRGLLFPATQKNEGNLNFNEKKETAHYFLSSSYRLGWKWGSGFHHDVRHNTRKTLKQVLFNCACNGELRGNNATHANIYLNDFIRIRFDNR